MACGPTRSIRGLISSRAAQEILLEELQVEVGYHMQVRRVEIHVLVEECNHEQQRRHERSPDEVEHLRRGLSVSP